MSQDIVDDLIAKAKSLNKEYRSSPNSELCNHALRLIEQALELTHSKHNQRWDMLADIGHWRHRLFMNHSKDIRDIDRAVAASEEALTAMPVDGCRMWRLLQLAEYTSERSSWTHSHEDVHRAVALYEEAESLSTQESPTIRNAVLKGLAECLDRRNDLTMSTVDLDRAIGIHEALQIVAPEDESSLHKIALYLRKRGTLALALSDIDRSVQALKKLISICPTDGLYHAELGMSLRQRYLLSSDEDDLEAAVHSGTEAVDMLSSMNTLGQLHAMNCLSCSLGLRYDQWGDLEDLTLSCELAKNAADTTEPDPDLPIRLHNYALRLQSRFDVWGDLSDLDLAETCLRDALRLESGTAGSAKISNASNYNILVSLSLNHFRRSHATRNLHDLTLSIDYLSRASLRPEYDIWIGGRLARTFLARHYSHGSVEDLNRSIQHIRENIDLPSTDIMQLGYWQLLSDCYSQRSTRVRTWCERIADLENAIQTMEMVLKKTPDGWRKRGAYLASMSEKHRLRSIAVWGRGLWGFDDDLHVAIKYATEACANTIKGSMDSQYALLVLVEGRIEQFRQSQSPELATLDDAICLLQQAGTLALDGTILVDSSVPVSELNACTHEKSSSAFDDQLLFCLARVYWFQQLWEEVDEKQRKTRRDTVTAFTACIKRPNSTPWQQIMAAIWLSSAYSMWGQFDEAVKSWDQTLSFLPLISRRALSRQDQITILQNMVGVPRAAAQDAIESGSTVDEAVMLLERGRGLMAAFSLEKRVDISRLSPGQAKVFQEARSKLERQSSPEARASELKSNSDSVSPLIQWMLESQQRYVAEQELQSVIEAIQSTSGTENFLAPPSLAEVRDTLGDNDTIVVINSSLVCNAFIINNQNASVQLLRLPALSWDDIEAWVVRTKAVRPLVDISMLSWLWTSLVQPVIEHLGFKRPVSGQCLPRVIWVATGPLCYLPIHAAGLYHEGNSVNAMDYIVSSYSLSLRAFVASNKLKQNKLHKGNKALLISMDRTPDLKPLPFAEREVEIVSPLCSEMSLDPIHLRRPKKEDVLAHIFNCTVFHFAGHATSNAFQPDDSGLVMFDDHLTVSDLVNQGLDEGQAPFLGFLSACMTGMNDADELIDEGLHLISAFQLSGFRHVVGTLWEVDDETCGKIAATVYQELAQKGISDDALYKGLHNGIMQLRDDWLQLHQRPGGILAENQVPNHIGSGKDIEIEENFGESMRLLQLSRARDTIPRSHRHASARVKGLKAGKLVRADWIPFMHYGA
ncbi:CHAT domain-containing protein [Xylariaceae sp. FL1019]|nr:CHAT domain-containing protein [Xylariaceae sp. FL1019]